LHLNIIVYEINGETALSVLQTGCGNLERQLSGHMSLFELFLGRHQVGNFLVGLLELSVNFSLPVGDVLDPVLEFGVDVILGSSCSVGSFTSESLRFKSQV
jgi:hypothetical protein